MQIDLEQLSDADLARLIANARTVQHERALADGDLDALVAEGFRSGFTRPGRAVDPWVTGRVLVCPGSLTGTSRSSHECSFVKVGEAWVWQAEERLLDEVRPLQSPGHFEQRSVTLLAAVDGLELDLVTCKARSGTHRLVAARSFVLDEGVLRLVRTRSVQVDGHGR